MKSIRITNNETALAYLASVGDEGPHGEWDAKRGGWIVSDRCSRCGGHGSREAWRYTGGTCFECGGQDTRNRVKFIPVVGYARRVKASHTKARKAQEEATANLERCRAWLAENGLEWMEEASHRIHKEMMSKLYLYGSLSEAQIGLALKVREQEEAEKHIEYPAEGSKVELEGTVSSIEIRYGTYGETWAVKVKTTGGWTAVMFTTAKAFRELGVGESIAFIGTVNKVGTGWCGIKRPKMSAS